MTEPDVDLDTVPRDQLGEHDQKYADVVDALDEWLWEVVDATLHDGGHSVGTFLDALAARGYRVEEIDPGPPIESLLPAAAD
jgi:hypothetical protein